MLLSAPVSQLAERMPVVASELRERFDFLRRPVATLNNAGREVEAMLQPPADSGTEKVIVADQGQGIIGWALGTLADMGTTLVATLLLAPFLLTATDAFRHKIVRVLPALSDKKRSLHVLNDIEFEVSRYLVTVTAINAGLGLCVAGTMALLGMETPYAWGAAAALLNYVPYVGPSIGIILVGASSLATHGAWSSALLPPVAYLGLQILEGAFITPAILGRRLELSPIAILATLALTTWMWGIIGTIIGVPLLVVVKVFCDRFPSLAPFGVFIAAGTPPLDDGESEPQHERAIPQPAPVIAATGEPVRRAAG
jgi:predicted PurR-regulated permease PerM